MQALHAVGVFSQKAFEFSASVRQCPLRQQVAVLIHQEFYGLPWEACVAYMEAHNAEPADPKVLARSQAFQRRMLDPSAPAPEKP